MSKQNNEPRYIEDPNCHDAYAETAQVLYGPPGLLRIELCVNRWTHQAPVHIDRIVPVARLALPIAVAKGLRDQLAKALEAIEAQTELAQAPAVAPTIQ